MHQLRLLLASSMALLAACTSPVAPLPDTTIPDEIPGPAYTTAVTATWTPAPGRTFGHIAVASAGEDAAVVYAELDDEDEAGVVRSRVLLRRLDAAGAVSGPPVELATVESTAYDGPPLALATDGVRYLACWQREGSIACAVVPTGDGPVVRALSVNGVWPSLAYGSGTFVLAYGGPKDVAIVRVASDGAAVGSAASFVAGEGTYHRTALAPAGSGFVLLDGDVESQGNVRVHRLDDALAPLAPPIDLGLPLWGRPAIAARGTDVAIGLPKPYGGEIFTLDGDTVTHDYDFSAGGKLGMNVALLADEASFGMFSTDSPPHPGLRYHTLQEDQVIASEKPLLPERDFERSDLAPLRLRGDLFLAATDEQRGHEILVVRVKLP